MNPAHAATAASHACCIGSETGSSDVAGAIGPQGKASGASRDQMKSPNTPGRRPVVKKCAVWSSVTAVR